MNYLTDPIEKLYKKLLFAAIGSMFTVMLASLIDTVILSHYLGPLMLSSISICMPINMVLNALALLIASGGTTLCATYVGRKEPEEANRFFTVTFICMVFVGLLLTVIGCSFTERIVALLGANEVVWQSTLDYASVLMKFMLPLMLYCLLLFFVRFDSDPGLSFTATLVFAVSNLLMDILFVGPLKMGPTGAALATGIGYSLAGLVCFTHFLKKKNTLKLKKGSFTRARLKSILGTGLPLSLSQFGMALATSIFNVQIMRTGGVMYVSAYAIISMLSSVALALYEGTAQAAQPILASNYGAGETERVKKAVRLGVKLVLILSGACLVVYCLFARTICGFFSLDEEEHIRIGMKAIRVFALSVPLAGLNTFGMYFLQSRRRVIPSTAISLLSRSVLMILSLLGLTACFGTRGIWWSWLCAQTLTILYTLRAVKKENERCIA